MKMASVTMAPITYNFLLNWIVEQMFQVAALAPLTCRATWSAKILGTAPMDSPWKMLSLPAGQLSGRACRRRPVCSSRWASPNK